MVITDIIADRMMPARHGNIEMHQYQMLKNARAVAVGEIIILRHHYKVRVVRSLDTHTTIVIYVKGGEMAMYLRRMHKKGLVAQVGTALPFHLILNQPAVHWVNTCKAELAH